MVVSQAVSSPQTRSRATIRVSPAQLQGAQVAGTSPQIAPARTSVVIGAARAVPVFPPDPW